MFHLHPPTDEAIRATLRGLAEAPFTYADVGATLAPLAAAPPGFVLARATRSRASRPTPPPSPAS
jgi:hypothetical protein